MPKKFTGENSKVAAAKERKAAAQAEKDSKARAVKEAKESAEWSVGAKRNKREDEEAKKAERVAKKAEAAALLAKEEAAAARKAAASASASKSLAPRAALRPVTGAAKVAARREQAIESASSQLDEPTPEYSASGLDAALELLDFAGISDSPSSSAAAAKAAKEVDRHPERRAKAAWLAFKEREMDAAKRENPGLRLSQLNEVLWKRWQKSPENPFNMTTVAYNATADDERQVVEDKRNAALDRMRVQ